MEQWSYKLVEEELYGTKMTVAKVYDENGIFLFILSGPDAGKRASIICTWPKVNEEIEILKKQREGLRLTLMEILARYTIALSESPNEPDPDVVAMIREAYKLVAEQ